MNIYWQKAIEIRLIYCYIMTKSLSNTCTILIVIALIQPVARREYEITVCLPSPKFYYTHIDLKK